MNIGPRLALALLWCLHLLPFSWLAALGRGLGRVLHVLASKRRHIARVNIALCFPDWTVAQQHALVREHFVWLGQSLLERCYLWWASPERIRALIRIEGDPKLTERSERPVMWLVVHFLGLEVAGVAVQLAQSKTAVNIYQRQSNPVWNAALIKGRLRFGRAETFARDESVRPVLKRIKEGQPFFNMPDMDFGDRDAAFVPFFGIPAATLLAPSRMARALGMVVQPVVTELLPGGQGWVVRFLDPLPDWPSADAEADTRAMNAWLETEIRRNPAQYLWVHKRFKTRPPGEPGVY